MFLIHTHKHTHKHTHTYIYTLTNTHIHTHGGMRHVLAMANNTFTQHFMHSGHPLLPRGHPVWECTIVGNKSRDPGKYEGILCPRLGLSAQQ